MNVRLLITCQLLFIAAVHIAVGVFCYYGRTKNLLGIFHSDLVIFLLPALVAFLSYFCVVWFGISQRNSIIKAGVATLTGLALTAVSLYCTLAIAFNWLGT